MVGIWSVLGLPSGAPLDGDAPSNDPLEHGERKPKSDTMPEGTDEVRLPSVALVDGCAVAAVLVLFGGLRRPVGYGLNQRGHFTVNTPGY